MTEYKDGRGDYYLAEGKREEEAAAMTSSASQPRNLTRESLAAALRVLRRMSDDLADALLDGRQPDDISDADWEAANEAFLAALSSPAPEPPPQDEDEALHEILRETAKRYEGLNWRETFEPIEGAAQPAPDPEAIRLLRELLTAMKAEWDGGIIDNETRRLGWAAMAQAVLFLQAHESGGEP